MPCDNLPCQDFNCSRRSECRRFDNNVKEFDKLKYEWNGECDFFLPADMSMTMEEILENRNEEARERFRETFGS